jgi:hypothetical protein
MRLLIMPFDINCGNSIFWKKPKLHITGLFMHLRISASGYEKPQSALSAFVWFYLRHRFLFAKNATHFPYRKPKIIIYSRNVRCKFA